MVDPVVMAAGVAAAESFGAEFGKALGGEVAKRLFGSRSNEGKQVRKALQEIISRLAVLERKLDNLTRMVAELAGLVIEAPRVTSRDEAYGYLVAALAIPDGVIVQPDRQLRIELLSRWITIVNYENRADKLLELPYWTEVVRQQVVVNVDSTFSSHLSAKRKAIQALIDDAKASASNKFSSAKELMDGKYFDKYTPAQIIPKPPYIKEKALPAPKVKVVRFLSKANKLLAHDPPDHDPGRPEPRTVLVLVPDPAFLREQQVRKEKFNQLRKEIATPMNTIAALTPAVLLLDRYIKFLK